MNILSKRTKKELWFDYLRFRASFSRAFKKKPAEDKLHIGCGSRRVKGFVNVDIVNSDYNVDLSSGHLPWNDDSISIIVCQQVVEHLEAELELLPLLYEFHRVLKPGGRAYISCPDMAVVISDYVNRGENLVTDRSSRWSDFNLNGMPSVHMINHLFHQGGEHKNLFDFELMNYILKKAGFSSVRRLNEDSFLERLDMDFPRRNDSWISLYVEVTK
jgi:predicted SAM-dependent methyltransferase